MKGAESIIIPYRVLSRDIVGLGNDNFGTERTRRKKTPPRLASKTTKSSRLCYQNVVINVHVQQSA